MTMTTTRYTRSRTRRKPHDILGLSPLKQVTDPPDLVREVHSSPMKKDQYRPLKKAVKFSEELTTPMGDNNTAGFRVLDFLPPRLILKSIVSTEVSYSSTPTRNYGDLTFWSPGLIVELPSLSMSEVRLLIDGAIRVLCQPQFDRRFEVYASLSSMLKNNLSPELVKYLTNQPLGPKRAPITLLSLIIRSDITLLAQESSCQDEITTRNDPFQVRTMGQALRLMTAFMSDESLNSYLALDDIRWFYRQAATLLTRSLVSKALTLPLLQLLKDCKFSRSMRRNIFDNNEIIELMLMALINMQCFSSSTILSERVIAFHNYCIMFAPIMAKNAAHWVGPLVLSIITTAAQVPKSAAVVVQTFTEICKVGEKHPDITRALNDFLNQELTSQTAELVVELKLTNEAIEVEGQCGEDIVLQGLERLIELDRAVPALDLWLLFSVCLKKILPKWRMIPYIAYHKDITWPAIRSWRVYIQLLGEKDGWEAEVVPRKFHDLVDIVRDPLLWRPTPNNYYSNSMVMDTLYYTIHRSIALMTTKSLRGYWEIVIVPMMTDAFFKLDEEAALQGYRILLHLTLTAPIVPYLHDKIYSEEPIQMHEINCLPRPWIAKNAKIVAPLLSQALRSLNDSARGMLLASQYLQSVCKLTLIDQISFINELELVFDSMFDTCEKDVKVVEALFRYFSPQAILATTVLQRLFATKKSAHDVLSRILTLEISLDDIFSFLKRTAEQNDDVWNVFIEVAMEEPRMSDLELYQLLIPYVTSCQVFAKFIEWLLEQMLDIAILDPLNWSKTMIYHDDFSILIPHVLGRLKDPSTTKLAIEFMSRYPELLISVVKDIYHIGTQILDESSKGDFHCAWKSILICKANSVANSGSEYDCHMLDDLLCKSESETGVILHLEPNTLERFPMYKFARMEPDDGAIEDEEGELLAEDDGIDVVLVNLSLRIVSDEGRVTRSKSRKVKGATVDADKKKRKHARRLKRSSDLLQETLTDSISDPDSVEVVTPKRRKVANFKRLYEVLSTWSQEDSQHLTTEQKNTLEKMALEFMLSLKK